MEFVEFHGRASGLTTSSTITLSFDRSVTSASDIQGYVIYAIGESTGTAWTQDASAGSVGIWDGTNEMCTWWGMNRGNSNESEYRHHWRDDTSIALWSESSNTTLLRCSYSSASTTGITLNVDAVSSTSVFVSFHGFAIIGSDCNVEAKNYVQTSTTGSASTTLDFSNLTSVDAAWGWSFSNDDISNTGMADEGSNTASSTYRGHLTPGQWMACSSGSRSMWGMSQDGGTLVDTSVNMKTDTKVFGTVVNAINTNFHSYIDLGFQPGSVANRLTFTNNGGQARGYGMIVLALETSNDVSIGSMYRAVSDTGTETVSPGFTQLGLMSTVSMGGWGNDTDAPSIDQTDGTNVGCNLGMGGFARHDGTSVGSFGIRTSMIDSNGAVRGQLSRWSGPSNVSEAIMEADTDWYSRFCSVSHAPADVTTGTQNDISGMYVSNFDGTTGDLTITHDDATATGSQNKGIRTFWMAIEEGGGAAAQTLDLDTNDNAIPSGEAVGSHTLLPEQFVDPSSIASGEAIGSHTLLPEQFVLPTSIDSGEAIGSHTIDTSIIISSAGSITSDEAIGGHTIDAGVVTIQPSSITSEESFGSPTLDPTAEIISIGIADGGEDIGSHTINVGALTISGAGDIASGEAFGTANIHAEITVSPTGIASEEAFETPSILKVAYPIDPTGINDGGQSFGTLVVNTFNVVLPTSITSEEAHGSTTVGVGNANIQPTGNDFSVSLDTPTIRTGSSIYLDDAVADSGEAFGTFTVTTGDVNVTIVTNQDSKGGIPSEETMGDNQVVGPVILDLTNRGVASEEAFGTTVTTGNAYVDVDELGISSDEIVGTGGSVTGPPAGPIQPKLPNPGGQSGIPSKEAFGTAEMVKQFPDQFPQPTGIASAEAFGSPEIVANFTVTQSNSIAESDNYYNGVSVQGSAIQVPKNAEIAVGPAPPITAGGNDFSVTMPSNVEIRAGFTITNDPVLKPNQNGIGGMESEEAFGTHNVGPGSVGNIVSAENFGTHSVVYTPRTLEVTGIASAESLGEPTIDPTHDIIAIGIEDGGEDIGTAEIQPGAITLEPTGVASEEAIGSIEDIELTVQGITGIASAEAFGGATIETTFVISDAGNIASEEAVGDAEIKATISTILGTGIASEEAFGSHTLDLSITLEPTGIASEESVQEVGLDLFIQGITGIESAEGVNHPVVLPGEVTIETTGLASEEAFGTAEIAATYNITDAGDIASEEAIGSIEDIELTVQGITGIASEEAFGTANIYATIGIIGVGSIASEEAVGSIEDIERTADLPSIASEEAFGTAEIAATYNITDAGNIASEEAIGSIEDIELTVQGITGIPSEEAIGTLELQPRIDIIGDAGIDNGEQFGEVGLNLFIQGATSIDSEEAHGTGNIFTEIDIIVPQGIDNSEQFGDPGVNLTVGGFSGINSEETLGAAEIQPGPVTVEATGIASEEAIGSIEDIERTADLPSIASEEAFGTAAIFGEIDVITPSFIDGAEDFGTPSLEAEIDVIVTQGIDAPSPNVGVPSVLPGGVTVEATGIASEESVQEVGLNLTVQGITGIASEEAFGTAEITSNLDVLIDQIASEEAFGTAELQPGGVQIDATGIASEEAFGQTTLAPGEIIAELTGIESDEAFGTAEIIPGGVATVLPSFIDGAEDVGEPSLLTGAVPVAATGIASAEAVGTLEVIQQTTIVPVQHMNASWDEIQELDASSD